MARTKSGEVKFVYVPSDIAPNFPQNYVVDDNTIYFVEYSEGTANRNKIFIGGDKFSDVSDVTLDNIDALVRTVLDNPEYDYTVTKVGSGNYVQDISIDGREIIVTMGEVAGISIGFPQDTGNIVEVNIGSESSQSVSTSLGTSEGTIYTTNSKIKINQPTFTVNDSAQTITVDFGGGVSSTIQLSGMISSAGGQVLRFLGKTETQIVEGSTTSVIVNGETIAPQSGDVVIYGKKEFVYTSTGWAEFGSPLEGEFAEKSVTITGVGALSGGGDLSANRQIEHTKVSNNPKTYGTDDSAPLEVIKNIEVNEYGHVTNATSKKLGPTITSMIDNASNEVKSWTNDKLSGYASKDYVQSNFVTNSVLDRQLNALQSEIANNYATTDFVQENYLSAYDAQTNYVQKSELNSRLLTNYFTKTDIISNYYNKSEVDSKISSAMDGIDLSGYQRVIDKLGFAEYGQDGAVEPQDYDGEAFLVTDGASTRSIRTNLKIASDAEVNTMIDSVFG